MYLTLCWCCTKKGAGIVLWCCQNCKDLGLIPDGAWTVEQDAITPPAPDRSEFTGEKAVAK